ncbi:short chain dehydrogenase [Mesorhizobium sp. B2-7-3]|uniref:short chain dehydrogenase n=1 Tax=Mesorhizobium sp. B2-7-3 TaxID=2589907 RepID=UPI00112B5A46|nr:short chain dehydrogenase [Mesorhizobium sp. B2-7-3]TPJ18897.1 short chain dehydrogenase [Mesorhizobium sp. B2-7-3]
MKIVLVGASGTIGSAVAAELRRRHDVISAGRTAGDLRVDIADPVSIDQFFKDLGEFDALACMAGAVHYAHLADFTPEQFEVGLRSKLMGQVNLVLQGLNQISDGGSFTVTSGLTNDDPIVQGAASSLVNGGLEGFVKGAAIETRRGIRINAVSPTLVEESLDAYGEFFPGVKPIPVRDVVLGYLKSIEGSQTGRVYRMGWSRDG